MRLSKQDGNNLFRMTVANGLMPTEFTLSRQVAWSGIYHEQSGSHFLLAPNIPNLFILKFSSSSYDAKIKVRNEQEKKYQAMAWHNVGFLMRDWARRVIDKDAWTNNDQTREAFKSAQSEETGNAPFTQDEQRQIAAQLQSVITYLKEESTRASEDLKEIDEKVDEVIEASKYMGRKDWLVYLLGTITALVITATVAAPVGEHIFTMVVHGLAHLFTGGNELPRLPPSVIM